MYFVTLRQNILILTIHFRVMITTSFCSFLFSSNRKPYKDWKVGDSVKICKSSFFDEEDEGEIVEIGEHKVKVKLCAYGGPMPHFYEKWFYKFIVVNPIELKNGDQLWWK